MFFGQYVFLSVGGLPSDQMLLWAYGYRSLPVGSCYHRSYYYHNPAHHDDDGCRNDNSPACRNNDHYCGHRDGRYSGFLSAQTAVGWDLPGLPQS